MKIAGIIKDDIADGEGICTSLWVQGCPIRCKGCHNPHTWDFNGGVEMDNKELIKILKKYLASNNIQRNFSVLGGEPLCLENIGDVSDIICEIKKEYPDIKIFIWTGYKIPSEFYHNPGYAYDSLYEILENADYIIDSPYEDDKRDITLKWRGSSNQRIWHKINDEWVQEE